RRERNLAVARQDVGGISAGESYPSRAVDLFSELDLNPFCDAHLLALPEPMAPGKREPPSILGGLQEQEFDRAARFFSAMQTTGDDPASIRHEQVARVEVRA